MHHLLQGKRAAFSKPLLKSERRGREDGRNDPGDMDVWTGQSKEKQRPIWDNLSMVLMNIL